MNVAYHTIFQTENVQAAAVKFYMRQCGNLFLVIPANLQGTAEDPGLLSRDHITVSSRRTNGYSPIPIRPIIGYSPIVDTTPGYSPILDIIPGYILILDTTPGYSPTLYTTPDTVRY